MKGHRYESDANIIGINGPSVASLKTPTIHPFEDGDRSILDQIIEPSVSVPNFSLCRLDARLARSNKVLTRRPQLACPTFAASGLPISLSPCCWQ